MSRQLRTAVALAVGSAAALLLVLVLRERRGEEQVTPAQSTAEEASHTTPSALEPPPVSAPSSSGERRALQLVAQEEAESKPNDAAPSTLTEPPEADWPGRCSVHGELTWEDGEPVLEAPRVHAARLGEASHEGEPPRPHVDLVAHRYRVQDLMPGSWELRADARGAAPVVLRIEVRAIDEGLRRDFSLVRTWLVKVAVVDEQGRPFALPDSDRARVRGELEYSRPLTIRASQTAPLEGRLADPVGRVVRPDPGWGEEYLAALEIDEAVPLHVSLFDTSELLGTQLVLPGQSEVRFALDPEKRLAELGSLTFAVVDASTGRPVEECLVELTSPEAPGNTHGFSLPEGRGLVERLPAGEWRLALFGNAYEWKTLHVRLSPGERRDLGRIELERSLDATVRVIDMEGRPVVGATVAVSRLAPGSLPAPVGNGYWTDPEGRAGLLAPHGTFAAFVQAGPWGRPLTSSSVRFEVPQPPGAEPVLVAAPPLEVRLHGGLGLPPGGAPIAVLDASGAGRFQGTLGPGEEQRLELPVGAFQAVLTVPRSGVELRRVSFEVEAAGGDEPLRVVIEP